MRVKISLGFSIEVDEDGRFELPNMKFTTAELKKIAREVGRAIRSNFAERDIMGVDDYE